MAPQPVAVVDEEDSSYSDSAAAAAPLLNLRVYPSGGSDEDEDVDKILFEDAQEEDDIHFIMSSPPGKVVKFADDVAEQQDAKRDHGKSRSELLTKIARLTDVLKDAEMAVDVEKEKRKKKEKNLLKLAKELKKRNQKREGDIERMEELEEKKRYLEHHWILAQKELDQEKALRLKTQTEASQEHELAVKDEKARLVKIVEEHEARLAELKRSHEKQCEELGRELLKQKLEADRLFNELTTKGIDVPRRALFKEETAAASNGGFRQLFLTSLIVSLAVFGTWGYQIDLFTKSGICAPVVPGTEFNEHTNDVTFQSPWWVPQEYKHEVFSKLCVKQEDGDATPSTVTWIKEGKMNKLIVSVGEQEHSLKKVVKAELLSSKMRLWRRNGLAEEAESLW